MNLKPLFIKAREYFNLMPHKEDEQEIREQVNSGITFRGGNLWVLIFAILIASLGLNVNSTAVIIGAMLISPLMGPIIGIGFALGTNDIDMLKRSAKNYGAATLISVLTASLYFLITPLSDAQSELLARTSPTLYDVLIAFCGGAAGIIAMCSKGKGNVIPGVAIATALMPPLCTAGYGIGTGHMLYFLGAFYLYFINSVFICLATFLGVRMMHFERVVFLSPERTQKARRIVSSIVIITLIPAAILTVNIVRKSIFDNNVYRFVKSELTQSGTQIISTEADKNGHTLNVVAVGKEIANNTQQVAANHMGHYGLSGYTLNIIQGTHPDMWQLNQLASTWEREHQRANELSDSALHYQQELKKYTVYDSLSSSLTKEVAVLFPEIRKISLSKVPTDSLRRVVVIADMNDSKQLNRQQGKRLEM